MASWVSSPRVDDLIAQKSYDKAIEVLDARLEKDPRNVRLRLQLGDVLALSGRRDRAVRVLLELVDQLAADGFVPKAIVLLKKVQKLQPRNPGVEERLADLCQSEDGQAIARRSGILKAPAAAPKSDGGISAPASATRPPLFSDFGRDELVEVIRGLKFLSFEPGAILMTEGERGDSLLILTSGSVRAFVKNQEGRNNEVRTMEEGEFFGEISLLTGKPRTATVTAATPVELLELDRATLDDISSRHPRVRAVVEEFAKKRGGSERERLARVTG
ncbi:MAG TPA: tetratricopeptide repeat protein [Vicinamibacteria bacterium]|jgi:cAMP-dependent protein kinase regulator